MNLTSATRQKISHHFQSGPKFRPVIHIALMFLVTMSLYTESNADESEQQSIGSCCKLGWQRS